MKLYNQLSRTVEEFNPLSNREVRMYSCGPTVYDHAHIGNLSSFIFVDTLRRALQLAGYNVTHAMNYTDVDDKTIRRSHEKYPQEDALKALAKLTDHYISIFRDDMHAVGNDNSAITYLRATEYIEEMRQLITKLYQQGFAYIAEDGVYFSIEAYRKSGKKYGQLLEITATNTSAARIQNDEYDKESVHDFSLWKTQKEGEPAWTFTLDGKDLDGRPGWHIECSVMSRHALGQPFDIHTGGIDLLFPHHENEIAQSTALEADPRMAAFFVHNDHILVDGKKMAKSAQNFYTLTDITDKGYDPLAFRMMMLQSHYRSQVNFTWESLEAAQNRLRRWRATADLRWQANNTPQDTLSETISMALCDASSSLSNDLDTPSVLVAIDQAMDAIDQAGKAAGALPEFSKLLTFIEQTLGLKITNEDISPEIAALIASRETARAAKDWAISDTLRDELAKKGIGVRDTSDGTVWYRVAS